MKKFMRLTSVILTLGLVLSGCGRNEGTSSNTPSAQKSNTNIIQTPLEGTKGYAGEGFENLFDRNTGTKWCIEFSENSYVMWSVSSPVSITGYKIVTANDNSTYKGRNPLTWTLYGCNSNSKPDANYSGWEAIDTRKNDTNLEDKDYTEYKFTISKTVPEYNYYMLVVRSNKGDRAMQMSEFMLLYDGVDETLTNYETHDNTNGGYNNNTSVSMPDTKKTQCNFCNGTGYRTCNTCNGRGTVTNRTTVPHYSGLNGAGGTTSTTKTCPNSLCKNGKVDCSYCGGNGYR